MDAQFNVTLSHITAGVAGHANRNALSLAAKDAFPRAKKISVQEWHIVIDWDWFRKSPALLKWDEDFDEGKPVEPITILLNDKDKTASIKG